MPPQKLIFDIGAHQGKYTDKFLSEGARVIAVEPQPGLAAALRDKYKDNVNVAVLEMAAGAERGKRNLWITAVSWLATLNPTKWKTGRFSGYNWNNSIEVDLITLDEIIGAYGMPDFIKIDVEGCEAEVLRGITKPVPLISCEFSGEFIPDVEECCTILLGIGNYEFAISPYETGSKSDYMNIYNLIKGLQSVQDPMFWGDIFARLKNG